MSSTLTKAAILFLALHATVATGGARAQSPDLPSDVRLVGFTVEPEGPEFGQVFDLRVTVRIGPGLIAFLPDTLVAGDASASAGSGDWSETSGPADSVDIQASYPVMGFLSGVVELPSLELWTRPAGPGEVGGARPASDLVDVGSALGDELQASLDFGRGYPDHSVLGGGRGDRRFLPPSGGGCARWPVEHLVPLGSCYRPRRCELGLAPHFPTVAGEAKRRPTKRARSVSAR